MNTFSIGPTYKCRSCGETFIESGFNTAHKLVPTCLEEAGKQPDTYPLINVHECRTVFKIKQEGIGDLIGFGSVQQTSEQKDIGYLSESALAKLRKPLFSDETEEQPIERRGRYISFVGYFAICDPNFNPDCDDDLDMDDYVDYQQYVMAAHRRGLDNILSGRDIISASKKDSLTVTYYSDDDPEWMIVVADCSPGGWLESARVKIDSFEGEAAVPPGCECIPNS